MKKFVFIFALLLTGCSDGSAARATLSKAGFSDVEITGWKPFNCGQDDFSSTGFVATNSNGQRIDGVVCCGLIFKNCTIRF